MAVTYFRTAKRGPEEIIQKAIVRKIDQLFPASRRTINWTAGSAAVGAGMPDLTIVSCPPQIFTVARVTIPDAELLSYLKAVNVAGFDKIAKRLGNRRSELRRNLNRLVQAKAICAQRNLFSLTPAWRDIPLEITTIEVKVANWRRALAQAVRNTIFANRSYVAFPDRVAARVRNSPIFRQFGIGVLAVSKNKDVKVVRRARLYRPRVWSYYYRLAVLASNHCKRCRS
jgi:hypothetical protein